MAVPAHWCIGALDRGMEGGCCARCVLLCMPPVCGDCRPACPKQVQDGANA